MSHGDLQPLGLPRLQKILEKLGYADPHDFKEANDGLAVSRYDIKVGPDRKLWLAPKRKDGHCIPTDDFIPEDL